MAKQKHGRPRQKPKAPLPKKPGKVVEHNVHYTHNNGKVHVSCTCGAQLGRHGNHPAVYEIGKAHLRAVTRRDDA